MPLPVIITGALVGLGVVLVSESRAKSKRTDGDLPGKGVEATVAGERESESGKVMAIDTTGQGVPMTPIDIGYKPDTEAMEDVPHPTPSGFPDMTPVQSDPSQASPTWTNARGTLQAGVAAVMSQKPATSPGLMSKPFDPRRIENPIMGGKGAGTRVIPIFKIPTKGMTKVRAGAVLSANKTGRVIF